MNAAVAAEGIDVYGWNQTGPYTAKVGVAGVSVGASNGERDGYIAAYGGLERITQYVGNTGESTTAKEPIILLEGGYGRVVAGSYSAGHHGEDTGLYLGVRGGPYAVGIGFSLDFIYLLWGPFGPAQTDNPWFQGPSGPEAGTPER